MCQASYSLLFTGIYSQIALYEDSECALSFEQVGEPPTMVAILSKVATLEYRSILLLLGLKLVLKESTFIQVYMVGVLTLTN